MNRIKELREEIDMTAKELAKLVGVSPSMMMYYEKGASMPKDNETWEKMAKVFKVSVPFVMGLTIDANRLYLEKMSVEGALDLLAEQPVAYIPETGAEIEILMWLSYLDEKDKENMSQHMFKLLKKNKYRGCADIEVLFQDDELS